MLDLIVSVPDHCLSFLLFLFTKFACVEFECMFSFVPLLFISLLELFL